MIYDIRKYCVEFYNQAARCMQNLHSSVEYGIQGLWNWYFVTQRMVLKMLTMKNYNYHLILRRQQERWK